MTETVAPAPTRIVFGTDGWRARIAEDFTFENVRRCADGVARCVVERGDQAKGVVVAYDRRFASEHFARAAAEVLLAHEPVARHLAQKVPDHSAEGLRDQARIVESDRPLRAHPRLRPKPTGSPGTRP